MTTLAFKFGSLFLKQLSKPISTRLRTFVLGHPVWRERTLKFARAVHRWEVYAASVSTPGKRAPIIGELVDEKAIELASGLVSDTFVFTVAAVLLIYEYNRGQEANRKKNEALALERAKITLEAEEQRQELIKENVEQYKMIAQLAERVNGLEALIEQAKEAGEQRKWWAGARKGSASVHLKDA